MPDYYTRYRDPRATFIMIEVRVQTDDGRSSQPFHLRVTEEEFENMTTNSKRQAHRGEWPPPPMGVRYRVPPDFYSRSYADEPFGSRYERPFFNEDWYADFGRSPFGNGGQRPTPPPGPKPKPEEKQNTPPTPEAIRLANCIRLATLAGVVWTDGLDLQKLWKKAQRRCHPDVETGSHELWIELETIAIYFHFVKASSRERDRRTQQNYSGRSAG